MCTVTEELDTAMILLQGREWLEKVESRMKGGVVGMDGWMVWWGVSSTTVDATHASCVRDSHMCM